MMMKLRPNLRDFKHLESQKYSMGIVLQNTNLICSLLNKLFFFFFFFSLRNLFSKATDSREKIDREEHLDPPAHLLQSRGMGTPVLEEHVPGRVQPQLVTISLLYIYSCVNLFVSTSILHQQKLLKCVPNAKK